MGQVKGEEMKKLICPKCQKVHLHSIDGKCPGCGGMDYHNFENNDAYLRKKVEVVLEERRKLGLDGLVSGLNNIIINTEPDRQKAAVEEFLSYTGLNVTEAFEDSDFRTVVLKTPGSADFLIRRSAFSFFLLKETWDQNITRINLFISHRLNFFFTSSNISL